MAKFATVRNRAPHKGLVCNTPAYNLVQSQYKSICDINNIVRRAFAGDPTVFRAARCVDMSDAPSSLHEALQQTADARMAYESLPDAVRIAYPTPEAFYAACHDESQFARLRELGVANPQVIETPVEVKVVNPVTSEGTSDAQ